MTRLWIAPLSVALLASACKVAPTPAQYFDHQEPLPVEREAAAEELQDRILALGQALDRGDPGEAMIALAPAPDAYIITPAAGSALSGADQIQAVFQSFATGEEPVAVQEVEVSVGPRANIAWFRATMDVPRQEERLGGPVRMTGVYVRIEGAWQLVQAHLSTPTRPLPSPPPESPAADADSLAAG